jgi:adenosylhomocysteine nucleosidase
VTSRTPPPVLSADPHDYLVIVAMPEETGGIFAANNINVVYTGLGKVNATYALMSELARRAQNNRRPAVVINFGTAGSALFPTHSLVECTRFVQRDIDLSPLGFPRGVTPFDAESAVLTSCGFFPSMKQGICGSGDNFETAHSTPPKDAAGASTSANDLCFNVVDMEAYALAKVCVREGLDFVCVKYITDGAGSEAGNDWAANLPRAAEAFLQLFSEMTGTCLNQR